MNTFTTFAEFCRTHAVLSVAETIAIDIAVMQRVPELQSRIHPTSTGRRPRGKLLHDPLVWSDGSSLTWIIPAGFFSFMSFLLFSSSSSFFLLRAVFKNRQDREEMGCQRFLGTGRVRSGDEVWQASCASYLC